MSPRIPIRASFLALFCALFWTRADATTFQLQTVDSLGDDRGSQSSLAIDSHGVAHVSYIGDGKTFYASRHDTTWSIETVDSVGTVGYHTSLAMDRNDAPHISYFNNTNLRYATKASGSWQTELVESGGSVARQFSSIALDRDGNPAIAYFDDTNGDLMYATRVNGVWSIEIADSAGLVGFDNSLAFDSLGQACVSYQDLQGGLRFARRTASGWMPQVVEHGLGTGTFSSLALDPSGFAHISYGDIIAGVLKYAVETPSGWVIEPVDNTDGAGSFTSIQLAGGTSPRISYVAARTKRLKYASLSPIGWTIEVVDPFYPAADNSLQLDADGNPMISYYDALRTNLKFADSSIRLLEPHGGELWAAGSTQNILWAGVGPVDAYLSQDDGATYTKVTSAPAIYHTVQIAVPMWTTTFARAKVVRDSPPDTSTSPGILSIAPGLTSPWWTKLVDAVGLTGFTPSIQLTSSGSPRVTYWDTSAGAVRYASRTGGVWTSETVRGGLGSHTDSPMAISALGIPSVAYFNNVSHTLNWAVRVQGTWSSEIAVPLLAPAEHCSMALDRFGMPRIAYYESVPGRLVLAARFGVSWATEDVDVGANVGLWNSLALDSTGYPYISYYDGSAGDLKFASKTGAAWSIETVDAFGDVGTNTSLALDGSGDPHVSYVDASNGFLKYATKTLGIWHIETVDMSGRVGGATSIALDALGSPRIAYHDRLQRKLLFASRVNGAWKLETVTPAINAGSAASLALGSDGNAHIAYTEDVQSDLRYASSAVELNEIVPGSRWPVGAHRTVGWDGTGSVDISVSRDAGSTFGLIAAAVGGGSYSLLMPGPVSTQCEIRIQRAIPFSASTSDTFTVAAGVDLLSFRADPVPFETGAEVTWQTDPAVADLSGYRLERAPDGVTFAALLPLTTDTSYRDASAVSGTKYRLTAINGAGGEFVLGVAEFRPRKPLAAGPLPYRGGPLAISFATVGAGSAPAHAEVRLYDMRGRLVRTIALGDFAPGFQSVAWNGMDDRGRKVASGIYVLKSVSGGHERTMKITVVR